MSWGALSAIWLVGVLLTMLVLWLVFGGNAKADDCKPQMPADTLIGCVRGYVAIKSDSADFRVVTSLRCAVDA